jgi:endonuclease VIII
MDAFRTRRRSARVPRSRRYRSQRHPYAIAVPEGDTIHQVARSLRAALRDGPVAAFEAPSVRGPRPEPGESIDRIEARGKHVLIRFGGGSTLHTHLRMDGSWRIDPAAAGQHPRAGPPGRGAIARIDTASVAAVCSNTPTVELLGDGDLKRHPVLSQLGPDLCVADADLDTAVRRFDAFVDPRTEIGVALLDQRVAAGIGNVYRSEVLWACRIDPFTPLRDIDPGTRRVLLATAHDLLRTNLERGGPRRTVPQGLAVYDRAGRACPRCGTAIRSRRLGEQARTAWWCPVCQTPR